MLAKKRQGVRKKGEKELNALCCETLKVSAFEAISTRGTENNNGSLYGDYMFNNFSTEYKE